MNAKTTTQKSTVANTTLQIGAKVNAKRSDLVEFLCDDEGDKIEFTIIKFDKGWYTIEAENGLKMNARDKQLSASEKKAPAKAKKEKKSSPARTVATKEVRKSDESNTSRKARVALSSSNEDEVSNALSGSNVVELAKTSAVRKLLTSIGCMDDDFSWDKFEAIPDGLGVGLLRMRIGNLLRGALSKKAKREGTYKSSEHLCTFNNGEAEISISTYEAEVLGNIVTSEYNDEGAKQGASTWLCMAVQSLPVRSHSGVIVSMQRKGLVTVGEPSSAKDPHGSPIELTALGCRAYSAILNATKV
jgi:hypothetical protein